MSDFLAIGPGWASGESGTFNPIGLIVQPTIRLDPLFSTGSGIFDRIRLSVPNSIHLEPFSGSAVGTFTSLSVELQSKINLLPLTGQESGSFTSLSTLQVQPTIHLEPFYAPTQGIFGVLNIEIPVQLALGNMYISATYLRQALIKTMVIAASDVRDASGTIDVVRDDPALTELFTHVTGVLPSRQAETIVKGTGAEQVLPFDQIGGIVYPVGGPSQGHDANSLQHGVQILPLTGGGRGPVINNGEIITIGLLKSLLAGLLSETEFTEELKARLDKIPYTMPNTKNQTGYATHNDTIVLSHDWSGYPPQIDLELSQGVMTGITNSDVDGITYVEIPDQEIIFGHTGIVNDKQFTVKAAILEKSDPVVVPLAWSPANIVGPPITALTTISPSTNTTYNCMGLRVKGTLGLMNSDPYEVAGTMYAQLRVDGGTWVSIAAFHWHFAEQDSGSLTEDFDVIMAYDQGAHTYEFRGYLVTDSGDEASRQLTGSIQIATVGEIGSGTILSNDLQLKWSAKEQL